MDRREAVRDVIGHVVGAVDKANVFEEPFCHLTLRDVFPDEIYAEMLRCLPVAGDYRALPGRHKENLRADGTVTRVKIDLFPEYIRHLAAEKRPVWEIVGRALTSAEVQAAFARRLGPGLRRRFGDDFADIGMYAIPVLTRDTAGYRIPPHTDTHWKGITVQLYLPPDDEHADVGTIMNGRAPDGGFTVGHKMQFVPNSGYAFAVNDISWHSADPVGDAVKTRDSILLTYFVDSGLLRFLRNRGKRIGNFVLNEVRALGR
jgi:hypothetical protein